MLLPHHVWGLLAIMLLAGLLGGAINHFLMQEDAATAPSAHMGRNLIVGVGASFLVPLFLNMVSSDLVKEPAAGDYFPFLVFAGFCLVAAISSRAFIRTLSDRVLREVREAKQEARDAKAEVDNVQATLAPIVAKETEAEAPTQAEGESDDPARGKTSVTADRKLDEDELALLRALTSGRYTLRSLSGLAVDSRLPRPAVAPKLERLAEDGLVDSVALDQGPRWYITDKGRRVVSS